MKYAYPLRDVRAGVRCSKMYRSKKYVIDPAEGEPVVFVKKGTLVTPIGYDEVVVSKDGESVRPTGRFFRTAETIDPYHIILDLL